MWPHPRPTTIRLAADVVWMAASLDFGSMAIPTFCRPSVVVDLEGQAVAAGHLDRLPPSALAGSGLILPRGPSRHEPAAHWPAEVVELWVAGRP